MGAGLLLHSSTPETQTTAEGNHPAQRASPAFGRSSDRAAAVMGSPSDRLEGTLSTQQRVSHPAAGRHRVSLLCIAWFRKRLRRRVLHEVIAVSRSEYSGMGSALRVNERKHP